MWTQGGDQVQPGKGDSFQQDQMKGFAKDSMSNPDDYETKHPSNEKTFESVDVEKAGELSRTSSSDGDAAPDQNPLRLRHFTSATAFGPTLQYG